MCVTQLCTEYTLALQCINAKKCARFLPVNSRSGCVVRQVSIFWGLIVVVPQVLELQMRDARQAGCEVVCGLEIAISEGCLRPSWVSHGSVTGRHGLSWAFHGPEIAIRKGCRRSSWASHGSEMAITEGCHRPSLKMQQALVWNTPPICARPHHRSRCG